MGVRAAISRAASGCALMALSACVNPAFQDAVAGFGTVTAQTAGMQKERVTALVAAEQELIHQRLAQDRAQLRLSEGCLQIEAATIKNCSIVRLGGAAIPSAPRFSNVQRLAASIEGYGAALAALAGDFSADEESFTGSLAGLAASIGAVRGTIASIRGEEAPAEDPRLGAIAKLVAEAGNLYFAHQRSRALRRIVIASDPLIQEAVALLEQTQGQLSIYERSTLLAELNAAEQEATELAGRSAPVPVIRAAQDRLFELHGAYIRHGTDVKRFKAVGEAHAKLAQAARSGASAAELKAAIEAIIDLAGTAEETIETIRDSGEGGAQ